MLCWSCGKKIPDDANRCRYCEAEVDAEPTEEEMQAVEEMLAGMSPDMLSQLQAVFEQSRSGEEFVNRIMVGECPSCGGSNTSDCEKDPEVDDLLVGRCFDCGQLWCLDCGLLLKPTQPWCEQCFDESDEP